MDAKLLIDVSLIIPPGAEIKAHSVRRVRANQQSITKLLMDAAMGHAVRGKKQRVSTKRPSLERQAE
ncbi:hypothetical protein J4G48_0013170 [Bradyrhizobium barranii subsp. apii]|uniref:hypothetical protein n=1 Tax=Bradyrhizobium barranii TaxID=2992140 RepID=UPI001AA0BBA0|nr:hypothetical protein [Bradyrhizobium barranii]UPT98937.1 hypothetical protein J4G48_0013170 [Bradyrhizobium barranii subsp. apii]